MVTKKARIRFDNGGWEILSQGAALSSRVAMIEAGGDTEWMNFWFGFRPPKSWKDGKWHNVTVKAEIHE